MIRVFVRLYLEGTEPELDALQRELERRLGPSAVELVARRPGAYWKFPAWTELLLEFAWPEEESRAVRDVALTLGRGWQQPNELSAVWNHGPQASFCHPSVRWAEVALAER